MIDPSATDAAQNSSPQSGRSHGHRGAPEVAPQPWAPTGRRTQVSSDNPELTPPWVSFSSRLTHALRSLRPGQAGRLLLQAPWVLSLSRSKVHGLDGGGTAGRPCHPACAGVDNNHGISASGDHAVASGPTEPLAAAHTQARPGVSKERDPRCRSGECSHWGRSGRVGACAAGFVERGARWRRRDRGGQSRRRRQDHTIATAEALKCPQSTAMAPGAFLPGTFPPAC